MNEYLEGIKENKDIMINMIVFVIGVSFGYLADYETTLKAILIGIMLNVVLMALIMVKLDKVIKNARF